MMPGSHPSSTPWGGYRSVKVTLAPRYAETFHCAYRAHLRQWVVGPPEGQAAVGLDQFQARHLRPILRGTEAELCAVIPWRIDVMPLFTVTIDSTRRILWKAQRSTPFRGLVEYCMVG